MITCLGKKKGSLKRQENCFLGIQINANACFFIGQLFLFLIYFTLFLLRPYAQFNE